MNDADRYRQRAEMLRNQAAVTVDPEIKAAFLAIAKEYEEMAASAKRESFS